MTDEKKRVHVIVWSGGADSTMLLTERASKSSWDNPIIAITVDGHTQINKKQFASQRAAQKRYLAWAKTKGMHIRHCRITVAVLGGELGGSVTQAQTWLAHLPPYFPQRCQVSFGYIRPDDFWHYRHEALKLLRAFQNMGDPKADWEIEYPYEWTAKHSVLKSLHGWKVPNNCWWTCDRPPRVSVACGKCSKCLELKQGRSDLRARPKDAVQATDKR